jgi:molybdate transport system substrate-binding protein
VVPRSIYTVSGPLLPLLLAPARAEEIRIMNSRALTAAYNVLAPQFEKQTGYTLMTAFGPSMGKTPPSHPEPPRAWRTG